MQKVRVNATQARKQFYRLLNFVAEGNEVTISKADIATDIIVKRKEEPVKESEIAENLILANKTYGAINAAKKSK